MEKSLYFGGRQIKNYLVGFASIFSEIPYQDRIGKLKTVPINYGSPSDVISYLESNVDNAETANRNRLKDLTIPLFSFSMTALEKATDRKRAPHDTITVDLRKLGYGTGYVAMRPAPFKFSFELILWASSDTQAFEIIEQIIPYFNSPQQVTIEPLPRCPVSTTEVFLDGVEIDTSPDSQKYSATVTMTFSLTGWLLTQPRIWSTNMAFELNMLDNNSNVINNINDYSFGNKIVDLNDSPKPIQLIKDDYRFFLEQNKRFMDEFNFYVDMYYVLLENKIIDNNKQLLSDLSFDYVYKNNEIHLEHTDYSLILDKLLDLDYLMLNSEIQNGNISYDVEKYFEIFELMKNDKSDTLSVFDILLHNKLIKTSFFITDNKLSPSILMNLFGSFKIDIESKMYRLRLYLSLMENIKIEIAKYSKSPIFNSVLDYMILEELEIDYSGFFNKSTSYKKNKIKIDHDGVIFLYNTNDIQNITLDVYGEFLEYSKNKIILPHSLIKFDDIAFNDTPSIYNACITVTYDDGNQSHMYFTIIAANKKTNLDELIKTSNIEIDIDLFKKSDPYICFDPLSLNTYKMTDLEKIIPSFLYNSFYGSEFHFFKYYNIEQNDVIRLRNEVLYSIKLLREIYDLSVDIIPDFQNENIPTYGAEKILDVNNDAVIDGNDAYILGLQSIESNLYSLLPNGFILNNAAEISNWYSNFINSIGSIKTIISYIDLNKLFLLYSKALYSGFIQNNFYLTEDTDELFKMHILGIDKIFLGYILDLFEQLNISISIFLNFLNTVYGIDVQDIDSLKTLYGILFNLEYLDADKYTIERIYPDFLIDVKHAEKFFDLYSKLVEDEVIKKDISLINIKGIEFIITEIEGVKNENI